MCKQKRNCGIAHTEQKGSIKRYERGKNKTRKQKLYRKENPPEYQMTPQWKN